MITGLQQQYLGSDENVANPRNVVRIQHLKKVLKDLCNQGRSQGKSALPVRLVNSLTRIIRSNYTEDELNSYLSAGILPERLIQHILESDTDLEFKSKLTIVRVQFGDEMFKATKHALKQIIGDPVQLPK